MPHSTCAVVDKTAARHRACWSGYDPVDAHRLTGPRMPRVSDLNIAKNRGIVGVLSFAYTTKSTGTAASAMSPCAASWRTGWPACSPPATRSTVYQDARERNPQRWSGQTRNWTPVGLVTLNPERDTVVRAAASQIQLSSSIDAPLLSRSLIADDLARPFLLINVSLFGLERRFFAPACSSTCAVSSSSQDWPKATAAGGALRS